MPARVRIVRKLRFRKEKRERFAPVRFLRVIIVLGLVFAIGFAALRLFEEWQRRVWLPGSRITVVVAAGDPTIYSYNPEANNLVIIEVPKTTQVEASGGFGQWLAGSLWQLGEDDGQGGTVLSVSLEKALGLPIDGWIGEQGEALFEQKTLGFPAALWQAIFVGRHTNLTVFDRLNIILATSGVGVADRRNLNLVTTGAVKKTQLPDGLEAYVPVPDKAKTIFEILRDERVFGEGKTLLVVNTTAKQGIASEVARIAGTLGVKVMGTQTASRDVENCGVLGNQENINSYASRRLAQIFGCETRAEDPSGPGHLEIILGKGFAARF